MAGDWMKVEKDTPEKPEIAGLCAILSIGPDTAFTMCFKVWRWADSNTVDGYVKRVTLSFLDSIVGLPGFSQALIDVGWLKVRSDSLEFPNFNRHMGESAKQRALTANRMAKSRVEKCDAPSVTKSSPEKRREEKKEDTENPLPPLPFSSEAFAKAWSEWDQHRKEKRLKLTPTSIRKQFKELADMGEVRAIAAIEHSIAKCYQGIYEPRHQGRSAGQSREDDLMNELRDAERNAK